MKKQTAIFFYVLGIYVVLQFAWWGYHLIELTKEIDKSQVGVSKRVFMIISEGSVFFLIVLLGLWQIRSSIKKELKLSQHQNNFLLSVTHELKTPLAATKLYLQTIRKRELTTEKRNELLEKAVQENQRLEYMIDNILNASRLENRAIQLYKETFSLSILLQDIADRYTKNVQKSVVKTEIATGVSVFADRFMVEASVNNLLENAIKYAGLDEPILLSLTTLGGLKMIRVIDNGPGVPLEDRVSIFHKFVRSGNEETRTQKGTGLGLFIASEFMRMQGGGIAYHDNVPKGAIFEITL
jgi:K+-sensing histidine kinase KdpD